MSSYLHTGHALWVEGLRGEGMEIQRKTGDFPAPGESFRRFPRLAPIL
jgi:hypothetical protein